MIRFLADACLHHGIVEGCLRREPSMDFLSAHAALLEGLDDLAVLDLAAHQRRILVTSDISTMPYHFGEFLTRNGYCLVFLVSKKHPIGAVIDALVLIWSATEEAEWQNRIVELPLIGP